MVDSSFDLVQLYRLVWFDCIFNLFFNSVSPTIRSCSTHCLNLFDPEIDSVWSMIQSSLIHTSTLLESWFDPVWLNIWPDLTHVFVRPSQRATKRNSIRLSRSNQESSTSAQLRIHRFLQDSTQFYSLFNSVSAMDRPWSTHGSTLFDQIEKIWPGSAYAFIWSSQAKTHDSNLINCLDSVWPTIWIYLTHNSITLFDLCFEPVPIINQIRFDTWLNPVRFTFPTCSTCDLTLFDPRFDLVRLKPSLDHLNLRQKKTAFDRFGRIKIRATQPRINEFLQDLTLFNSWPCSTLLTLSDTLFALVWPSIRFCLTHYLNMVDSWLDPLQSYRPCLTYDLILFDPRFDQVWFMIEPSSIPISTLLDTWFNHFWARVLPGVT